MDLASALTTQGLLQKQSPNLFKVYQTRYFAIRGKGQFLVWFKKKPIDPDQNPKGIIKMQSISQIIEQQSDRLFSIVYLQRTFNFRAQSVAVKQRWVNALRTILNHYQKVNKNKSKPVQNKVESWKWENNMNHQISEQIRLENEEVILQDSDSSIGKKSEAFLAMITKEKSLFDIEKCIVYGFYMKKKLLMGSQRWYFLASGVNLKDQKDEQLYGATQTFLSELNAPQKQQSKQNSQKQQKRKQADSSSDQQQNAKAKDQTKKSLQNPKTLRINTLFEYDPQTKQVKYAYNLVDIVSFDMKTTEQPFELKIVYEQVINEEEQEIRENEICLSSNFLIEIKKLHTALKIINQKYNMQKTRQVKNANKSKRFAAKKWRYVNQDQWRIPEEKASLYVLLSKKFIRINMLSIYLEEISSHGKESVKVLESGGAGGEDGLIKKEEKKEDVLLIVYKKQKQQYKIYVQFDKIQTMMKFTKKLAKNIKKMQQAQQAETTAKITNKIQDKSVNQDTYLIDKKIRETHSSIKVNFYELMDREVIQEKKEDNGNKGNGFLGKIMAMFCAGPSPLDLA